MAFKYKIKYTRDGVTKTRRGESNSINELLEKFNDCDILELNITEMKVE